MGRYDISSMVNLLFFGKSMKQFCIIFSLLLSLILILPVGNTYSQAAKGEESDDEIPKFRLNHKYPTLVYSSYKMTETTKTWRQYSDSSIIEYKRELTFYFTVHAASPPEDGFHTLDVSIDSCEYYFKQGDSEVKFNSQSEELTGKRFLDKTASTVPLSREFQMTYSPYGEVAKIEGDDIDWLERNVLEKGKDKLDTLEKHIWLEGISFDHLTYIADLQKNILPNGIVSKDSVWKAAFQTEIDGIDFMDTVKTRIKEVKPAMYIIEAAADSLKPLDEKARFYGIKKILVDIDAAKGSGTYTVHLTPRGTIEKAVGDFHAELIPKIKKDRFFQKIDTKVEWQLLGQYKY